MRYITEQMMIDAGACRDGVNSLFKNRKRKCYKADVLLRLAIKLSTPGNALGYFGLHYLIEADYLANPESEKLKGLYYESLKFDFIGDKITASSQGLLDLFQKWLEISGEKR